MLSLGRGSAGGWGAKAAVMAGAAEAQAWVLRAEDTVGGHGGFLRDAALPVVFKPAQAGARGETESRALACVADAQAGNRELARRVFPAILGCALVGARRVDGFRGAASGGASRGRAALEELEALSAVWAPPVLGREGPGQDDGGSVCGGPGVLWAGASRLERPLPAPGAAGAGARVFFAMRDVCAGMSRPCVADVKLGSQMWSPGSRAAKVSADERKCTLQRRTGFRLTAMRVWRRSVGSAGCLADGCGGGGAPAPDGWVSARYGRGFCFSLDGRTALWALRLFLAAEAPEPDGGCATAEGEAAEAGGAVGPGGRAATSAVGQPLRGGAAETAAGAGPARRPAPGGDAAGLVVRPAASAGGAASSPRLPPTADGAGVPAPAVTIRGRPAGRRGRRLGSPARSAPLSAHGVRADIRRGTAPDADAAEQMPAAGSRLRLGVASALAAEVAACLAWCRRSPWHLYGSSLLLAYDAQPGAASAPRAVIIDFAHARPVDPAWEPAWQGAVTGVANVAAALRHIATGPRKLPAAPAPGDESVWSAPPVPPEGSAPRLELDRALAEARREPGTRL